MSVKAETPTDWKREDVFATSAFSPILLQADIDIRSVFPNRDNDIIFTEMLQKIRKHQKKWVIGMPPPKKKEKKEKYLPIRIYLIIVSLNLCGFFLPNCQNRPHRLYTRS